MKQFKGNEMHPQSPASRYHHNGGQISTYEFQGLTNIQSITRT
jgi:hypothetical protein